MVQTATDQISNTKKTILFLTPLFIIASTYLVFQMNVQFFGQKLGHFLGFVFYWLVWCIIFPILMIGMREALALFTSEIPLFSRKNIIFAILLPVFPVLTLITVFVPQITHTSLIVVIAGTLIGLVHGPLEELLWRGLYIKAFPNQFLFAVIYPTLGFVLWHIPQVRFHPKPPPMIPFLVSAVIFGIVFALPAWRTRSIKWPAIVHSVMGLLGLAATAYF